MPLSRETVERLFAEQVGRPIDPELAAAIAAMVGPLSDALQAVDPEPLFLIEPSTPFQASYPPERSRPDGLYE
jgi:hypothetical protein